MKIPIIQNLNLKHKRVFLRADLNIPLKDAAILQDYRLQSILPTIDYILKNGGKVILATHIGRPDAQSITNFYDKDLSTDILIDWFKQHNYKIKLERDLLKAEFESHENFGEIILLENLRFFNGEQGNNEERKTFAQLLKDLADIYVNDAFGLIHRNDTSVTLLPELFEKKDRAFGFLIEKEIKELSKLKQNPEKPFVLALGGNKIKDKIKLLENFINQNLVNSILIGGAISYTFLKAQGNNVGKSLVEGEYLDFANNFLKSAKEKNVQIVLPLDHLVVLNLDITKILSETDFSGVKIEICSTPKIPKIGTCVDIGPQTIELFKNKILQAKTIFTNGTMGIYTNPTFEKGSLQILQAIADNSGYTVVGGGDCVAASFKFNLQDKFRFLSTGGGATLAFLGSKNPDLDLPGLKLISSVFANCPH